MSKIILLKELVNKYHIPIPKDLALNFVALIFLQAIVRDLRSWDSSATGFENAEQEYWSKRLHSNTEPVPYLQRRTVSPSLHPCVGAASHELRRREVLRLVIPKLALHRSPKF